jgi:ubiquinone/menaquinone biosynthesis C-methylase UbiE
MTGEEYEHLYKRHLEKSPKELLELAGMKEGFRVLDLCAGSNGRASKAALEMGASRVVTIDLNSYVKLLAGQSWAHNKLESYCEDVYGYIEYMRSPKEEKFDIAICQQGVNYWLKREVLQKVFCVMKKYSKFVFDVFNDKPLEKPSLKEYELDGFDYVEIDWLDSNIVKHIQVVNNANPHYTEYKWLDSDSIKKICAQSFFSVEMVTQDNIDIYVATRESTPYEKHL